MPGCDRRGVGVRSAAGAEDPACRRFWIDDVRGAPWGPGYPIRPAAPGCASRGGLLGGRASRDRSEDRLEASSAGLPRPPRDASPERDEERRSQWSEWRSVAATAGSAEQSARAASRERVDMAEGKNQGKKREARPSRVSVSHVPNATTRVPEGGFGRLRRWTPPIGRLLVHRISFMHVL